MKLQVHLAFVLLLFSLSSWGAEKNKTNPAEKDDTLPAINFSFYGQGDAIAFWGDKEDEVRNRNNFKDGVNIPRARYAIFGKKWDWYYHLAFDASEIEVRDAFLRYEEYKYFRVLLGQYKIPYSFWFSTTHSRINFLELGLPTIAFVPGFRLGLQAQFLPDPFTFTAGIVTVSVDNKIRNTQIKGHTPLAGSGRITFSPLHTEKKALHVAAAAIYQETDSLERFTFRSFPEVQTDRNKFLVNTGFIEDCKNYIGQEFEAAFILGSFTLEGEYYHTTVYRKSEDLNFKGYAITADYFLTGENYIYDFKDGDIDRVSKIRNWYGAWQLALRYSKVDLQDEDINGGRERNTTVGLNWIANDNVKFMFNYIFADSYPSNTGVNRHLNIIGVRCQLSARSV